MFVGYKTDSGDDVYRMWNPDTKRLLRTRDIRWLGKMFYAPNNLNEVREGTDDDSSIEEIVDDDVVDEAEEVRDDENIDIESENLDIESENSDVNGPESDDEGGWQPTPARTRSGRTVKSPVRLIQEQGALGLAVLKLLVI